MKKLNLTGQTFGKLTVESHTPDGFALCKCSCGKLRKVRGFYLTSGNTQSCGCLRKESQLTNLVGEIIGNYTVISFDKEIKKGKKVINYWICKCDCGTIKSVTHRTLMKRNNVQNCGCKSKDDLIRRSSNPDAGYKKVYRSYITRAKTYKIDFSLTDDEFYSLTQNKCYYCGIEPSRISKAWSKYSPDFIYNGVDRIDSNIGYTVENCVTCCTKCNYAKSTMSLDEFKSWIIKLYNNLIN